MSYFAPGVYTEEVASGPQPIAAAPTSVAALVGSTEKGPFMKPTRVTGWSEYVTLFGGPISRGFSAESVAGFFDNGGPAVYVVRVDPSTQAAWLVKDGTGTDSFTIDASSPGTWANDLQITTTPDEAGGSGRLYSSTITAAKSIPQTTPTDIDVSSTAGVSIGDVLSVIRPGLAAAEVTVSAITPTGLKVTNAAAAAVAVVNGTGLATVAKTGATTVRLASANGLRQGDLLVAQLPDRNRITALVSTVENQGAGMAVTLSSGLSADIAAAQFASRTVRYRAEALNPDKNVSLGSVGATFVDGDLAPVAADLGATKYRAYAANGVYGEWVNGNSRFEFDAQPSSGPIEFEGPLLAHRYVATLDLTAIPAAERLAHISTQLDFVPQDTAVELTGPGPITKVTITKVATAFTVPGGSDATQNFTTATVLLPTDARKGAVVRSVAAIAVGEFVDFGGALGALAVTEVESPASTVYVLTFAENRDLATATGGRYKVKAILPTEFFPLRFTLDVSSGGVLQERFSNLGLHPSHPFYYVKDGQVNGVSKMIQVNPRSATAAAASAESVFPATIESTRSGADAVAGPQDYRDGFAKLEEEPEPAMVLCPESTMLADELNAADVIGAMVTHCEQFRRLAIVDSPDESDDQELVKWRNRTVASTYASVYAPHVMITPLDRDSVDRFTVVPPSGFVAGMMARVDRTPPGVATAPANQEIKRIVGLTQTYTSRKQELLNPNAVNVIRAFPGRGIRVWGARNATDDIPFRYTNVRRLFNAIETSIDRGTQWVVFQPNTASTWLRVRVSVEGFLEQRWRAGELAGNTPEEAFSVRVGLGETMVEDDVDLGLVIVEVAIAPVKPAEFVVFRFSHKRITA